MSIQELSADYYKKYPLQVAKFLENCLLYPNFHATPIELLNYSRRDSAIPYSNVVEMGRAEAFDIGDRASSFGASTCSLALITGESGSSKFVVGHLSANSGLPRTFNLQETLPTIYGTPRIILAGANPDQGGDKYRDSQIVKIMEQFSAHGIFVPRENFTTIWNDAPDSFLNMSGTVDANGRPSIQLELVARLQT